MRIAIRKRGRSTSRRPAVAEALIAASDAHDARPLDQFEAESDVGQVAWHLRRTARRGPDRPIRSDAGLSCDHAYLRQFRDAISCSFRATVRGNFG